MQKQRPDVLITDIEMPTLTGLEVAAELKRQNFPVRVIILTTFARAGYLRRALDAGASGYLLKDMPAEQLAEAVRRVHRGLRAIDPQLAAEAWSDEPDTLTDRERHIIVERRLVDEPKTLEDLSAKYGISRERVRQIEVRAFDKLQKAMKLQAHQQGLMAEAE